MIIQTNAGPVEILTIFPHLTGNHHIALVRCCGCFTIRGYNVTDPKDQLAVEREIRTDIKRCTCGAGVVMGLEH